MKVGNILAAVVPHLEKVGGNALKMTAPALSGSAKSTSLFHSLG